LAHLLAKLRQYLALEPRIGLEPRHVARTGVWQGQVTWQEIAPLAHRRGEVSRSTWTEEVGLRVLADQDVEPDLRQQRQQSRVPGGAAFRPRRCVAGPRLARVTEAHRHDRDLGRVVKRFAV